MEQTYLSELIIDDLGLIEHAQLDLQPGLTVLSGETGTGKTLVVTGLQLISGARADKNTVRHGATAARVQAVFTPPPASALEWIQPGQDPAQKQAKEKTNKGLAQAADSSKAVGSAKQAAESAKGEDSVSSALDNSPSAFTVEQEFFVTRDIAAQAAGRNRIRIQGQLATAAALQEIGSEIIELHGQNENVKLVQPHVQRMLLDLWGKDTIAGLAKEYGKVYSTWRTQLKTLRDAKEHATTNAREAQQLTMELEQIEAANIVKDEEIQLEQTIATLQHAKEIEDTVYLVRQYLLGADDDADYSGHGGTSGGSSSFGGRGRQAYVDGVQPPLSEAAAELQQAASMDVHPGFADLAARLSGIEGEIVDIAEELRTIFDDLDSDPDAFDNAMQRMAVLKGLFRMYGPTTQAVLQYQAEATARLEVVGGGTERIEALQKQVLATKKNLVAIGDKLTKARMKAATSLQQAVNAHLKDLAMPNASLHVHCEPAAKPQAHGLDIIEFWVQTNVGSQPGPLAKIASGGEKSRISLAIKAALAAIENTPILVFDEVDAGVGGKAATAIGQKLAMLAKRAQVICVTHVAQIAAYADNHFVVDKQDIDQRTVTSVTHVAAEERPVELARMLSGMEDSSVALDHAQELLDEATANKSS